MTIYESSYVFYKISKNLNLSDIIDFSRCLNIIIYESTKDVISNNIEKIIRIFCKLLVENQISAQIKPFFLASYLSFVLLSVDENNKNDNTMIGIEISLCFIDSIDQFSSMLSRACQQTISGKNIEKSVNLLKNYCILINKEIIKSEVREIFSVFLIRILNNFTLENLLKQDCFEVIIKLFLHCNEIMNQDIFIVVFSQICDISDFSFVKNIFIEIIKHFLTYKINILIIEKLFNIYFLKIKDAHVPYFYIIYLENSFDFDSIILLGNCECKSLIRSLDQGLEIKNENFDCYFTFFNYDLFENPNYLKLILKIVKICLISSQFKISKTLIDKILNYDSFDDITEFQKAIIYFYYFLASYFDDFKSDTLIKFNREWYEDLDFIECYNPSLEYLFTSRDFFDSFLRSIDNDNHESIVCNGIVKKIIDLCYFLVFFDFISLSYNLFQLLIHNKSLQLEKYNEKVIKISILYYFTCHGIDLSLAYNRINSKIQGDFYLWIFEIFKLNNLSDFSNFERIMEHYNMKNISLEENVWFLIFIGGFSSFSTNFHSFLSLKNFPIRSKLQCLFLAVKIIDRILQNHINSKSINSNISLLFLKMFCLENCAKILLKAGCFREANSLIFLLTQQSLIYKSPIFLRSCFNLLKLYNPEKNSEYEDKINSIENFIPKIENNFLHIFSNNNSSNSSSILIYNHKIDNISNLKNNDLESLKKVCDNCISKLFFECKLEYLHMRNLSLDLFSAQCCKQIDYEINEMIDELDSSDSKIKEKAGINIFPQCSIKTKFKLRKYVFENFENLSKNEINSFLQFSMSITFFNYLSLNQTKLYFEHKPNKTLWDFCEIFIKPKISLNEINEYITLKLYPFIHKTWTLININYFKMENDKFIILCINKNDEIFSFKYKIDLDFDIESTFQEIIDENDKSSSLKGDDYWNTRNSLESRLEKTIEILDAALFKNVHLLMNGAILDDKIKSKFYTKYQSFLKEFQEKIPYSLIEVLGFLI